jgi:hypothetical protein
VGAHALVTQRHPARCRIRSRNRSAAGRSGWPIAGATRMTGAAAVLRTGAWTGPRRAGPSVAPPPVQGRASSTMLNGVSAARRTDEKPPARSTSARRASPACVPSAARPGCESEPGVQTSVEKP